MNKNQKTNQALHILIATSPYFKNQKKHNNFVKYSIKNSFNFTIPQTFIPTAIACSITSPISVLQILLRVKRQGGSVPDAFSHLWNESGLFAFWKNNTIHSIYMSSKHSLQNILEKQYPRQLFFSNLISHSGFSHLLFNFKKFLWDGFSDSISSLCFYPLYKVQYLYQNYPEEYPSFFPALKSALLFHHSSSVLSDLLICSFPSFFHGMIHSIVHYGMTSLYANKQYFKFFNFQNTNNHSYINKRKINPKLIQRYALKKTIEEFLTQIITYPIFYTCQNTGDNKIGLNIRETISQIWELDGFSGFYTNFDISMVKVLPFTTVQSALNCVEKHLTK